MCQDAILLWVLQVAQDRTDVGARTSKRSIVEERPLHGVEPQRRTGKGIHWKTPVPGTGPSGKLKYTPTDQGHPLPLTLVACHPGWDDYLDLTETVTEMAHHLMKEDRQEVAMPPKAGTTPKKKEAVKSIMAPVNKGIAWVASDQFLSDQ